MGIQTAPNLCRSPLALAGLLTVLWWHGLAGAATPVPTVKVGAAGPDAAFEIEGTVQAVRQATVAAQTSGNVLALAVKAGDLVKAGQVLARVDDRDLSAGLARTDAGVAQADAEYRNARLAAERNRELRSKGFVSQAAVDVAETQLKAAQAALQQAQGARSQAALARGFASVTAPFDGVVLATLADAGDLASPGRALVSLYAPGAMRAVVQVPASRAALARQASARAVQLPAAGGTVATWVTPLRSAELPVTDPVAQTIEWRLDLPASAAVQPGQRVTVRFEGGAVATPTTSKALTVPATAVLRRGELEAVYVSDGRQFVLRAVRLGSGRSGATVEVLAGLKPGDVVALDAVRAGLADAAPAAPAASPSATSSAPR